ncbi:acyl-CoA dehydrogenase family protein [Pseudonocardia oroxyli]|uniref:Acyl-CoA dehydrogenase, C-terminal domain n=1 Tax=Pseudonocardia oroxyli TaxID=366584 RepID=A0A1G8D8K2_PSEOR|nr:acyl-CoA dehydrogenase family protein [Pseudonocardia oroxyli]SDH53844.1 Acyl-CoA dehydrogenase, C-terminal domain [Pseudonocardia oroxyli]
MDFRLDELDTDVARAARAAFSGRLSPERWTRPETGDAGWTLLGEDGWLDAGLADSDIDAPAGLSALTIIGREAGRSLAGDGFVNNAVLLSLLLDSASDKRGSAELVGRPGFLVADARTEDITGSSAGATSVCMGVEPGMSAYLVTRSGEIQRWPAHAWTFEPFGSLALGAGAVRLAADVEPDFVAEIGGPDREALLLMARTVHAASLVGLGEHALAETVAHVLRRDQFGGPIGRFQAIKHGLADVAVALEVAWNAVMYAAMDTDQASVSIAQIEARSASEAAARSMTQYFGGIAITWEHPAHLYLKTALVSGARFLSGEIANNRVLAALTEGSH